MTFPSRLVIGISGASGSIYGIRLLQVLRTTTSIEIHLVISKSAALTIAAETAFSLKDIQALAHFNYAPSDIASAIASGSFPTMGMIIAPCSIRTMSAIATGVTDTLLSRTADVTLKEKRPLILMVRETPFHLGHLRTMTQLAEMGAVIAPPVPAFYNRPTTIDELVNHSIGRVLDLLHIDSLLAKRWEGMGKRDK